VIAATALACIQEAITTSMTNLAQLFGGTLGVEGITNTTNWPHLVLLHGVVVFVPAFAVWSLLLHRYAFTAAEAFLLYGLTGTLAEALLMRLDSHFAGHWIFVYGCSSGCLRRRCGDRRACSHLAASLRARGAVAAPAAMPAAFVAIAVDRALGLSHVSMHGPFRRFFGRRRTRGDA
jgi:hypothetical protein